MGKCTKDITHLHLIDIDYVDNIKLRGRDVPYSFDSIVTLSLSVQHVKPVNNLMLSPIIEYAKKHYGHARTVVVLGRIDMTDVKKAIRNENSRLLQALQVHADTHFTFIDSTEINPNRKHLLFIPLCLYNRKTTMMELESRLSMLGEMNNWNWNKQGDSRVICKTCKARQGDYVTQFADGGIICDHCMRYNIRRKKNISLSTERNIQLKKTQYFWYPRCSIFLNPELGNRVYLAETGEIIEEKKKYRDELMIIKRKAKGTKRLTAPTHPMQEIARGTGIAGTSAAGQQQEPKSGSSWYMRGYTAEHIYALSQHPAIKWPRYESAVSDWNIFTQPVVPGVQDTEQTQDAAITEGLPVIAEPNRYTIMEYPKNK